MYLIEFMNSEPTLQVLNEIDETAANPSSNLIEFQDIKKYVLFGKIKEMKLKLELSTIDKNNPDVLNLFEFMDLIILFYNTFTYEQIQKLINTVVDTASQLLKIKIEPIDVNSQPALDQDALAQQQANDQAVQIQQQQQDMQQQQQNMQHKLIMKTGSHELKNIGKPSVKGVKHGKK